MRRSSNIDDHVTLCYVHYYRDTVFSEEDVEELGELGVVGIAVFESLERDDTGNYRCIATNRLPGNETGVRVAESSSISLTVLG